MHLIFYSTKRTQTLDLPSTHGISSCQSNYTSLLCLIISSYFLSLLYLLPYPSTLYIYLVWLVSPCTFITSQQRFHTNCDSRQSHKQCLYYSACKWQWPQIEDTPIFCNHVPTCKAQFTHNHYMWNFDVIIFFPIAYHTHRGTRFWN